MFEIRAFAAQPSRCDCDAQVIGDAATSPRRHLMNRFATTSLYWVGLRPTLFPCRSKSVKARRPLSRVSVRNGCYPVQETMSGNGLAFE